ncbi:VCBS repeat-containing protein [Arthrobacter sp. H5]|uniref:VCBS repeat-containing protein n=1 Tax=Arthrobacter sp. H5 TaxID=1267973 RepID=UPI0004ADED6E|nr:VCBS repeat-containing protein [Arthrobacter sp. H5]
MSKYQPTGDPPKRQRSKSLRLTSSVLSTALLMAALAPLAVAPAQAQLSAVGPINSQTGYPEWYSDGTVKLELCYTANSGCLAEPPDPTAPVSHPGNFPGEAFWFAAEASSGNLGLYEAALEAAHTTEEATTGEQIAFARLRFRLDGLVANASYTITHPYGAHTFVADAVGVINVTLDQGCDSNPCNFDLARAAFLGDYRATNATFLRQVGAAEGTIGSINVSAPVTGAPSGNNFVRVDGPNAGGPGVSTLTVNNFAIQGNISAAVDGAPSTPDLADASDSGRSSADNITNSTTPTFTGTATAGSSVQLVVDGANNGAPVLATGGTYTLTAATALTNGAHQIVARIVGPPALDSTPLAMTVDTAAPTATIVAPFPSSPSANNTPTFNFSSEAGAAFECQLLPSNGTFTACTSPKTWDAQLNGSYTFNVRATDVAGNVGAVVSRVIQIGPAAPPPPPPAAKQKDMNGDGKTDLIGRDSSGRLWYYAGNGNRGYSTRTLMGSGGWNSMDLILMPGDFNGDKRSDVIARDTTGRLWLYPGNGAGGLTARTQIGSSWNNLTAVATPGDFNGDSKVDLLARDSAGRLWLYPGNGTGGFITRILVGSGGWNSMNAVIGVGDFNGDSKADFHARDTTGRLWLYPGTGTGGHGTRTLIGSGGWNSMTALIGTGSFDANTTADLVARDDTGRLWLYPGSGTGSLLARVQIGTGWQIYTLMVP